MSTTTPLTDAINALTTYANEITGKSDTTLSDAVESLVDGYGGGGGGGTLIAPQIQGKPLTTAITSLITYVNTVTGQSDQTLSECIATLAAGYNTYKWKYSYSNGDFYVFKNGNYANASSAAQRLIILTPQSSRWSFGLYGGEIPLRGGDNGTRSWDYYTVIEPNIYPVPIPPTATKAIITPTPSTMKCQGDLCTINDTLEGYTRDVETGWTTGEKIVTFTAGRYTHIAPKTQGTVTELTVKFEE